MPALSSLNTQEVSLSESTCRGFPPISVHVPPPDPKTSTAAGCQTIDSESRDNFGSGACADVVDKQQYATPIDPTLDSAGADTQEVQLSNNPQPQTSKTLNLPQTYVAPPRLAVGLNTLDLQNGTNLRVSAYADDINKQQYTAHIDTWADTTLYSAGIDTLVLKPANLDILSGEFSTQDDHPWNQPQAQTSRRINFERPFITTPKVVVFLREFDTGGGSSTRVRTYTSDIDAKGFTIHIDTWSDTTLYSAIASWVAYPEDKDYIYSDSVSTLEVRPWQSPQAQTHKDINFQGTLFLRKPTVFVALNSIDISTEANLRVRGYVDNVATGGLTWHIDSWADTKLWSAGLSYIAFN